MNDDEERVLPSLTAVLSSLPSPSLAETDLSRFAALALGRRHRAELAPLAAFFEEEILPGFEPGVAPVMEALVRTLLEENIDPAFVDARRVDELFGSEVFLGFLEQRVEVSRRSLRPGTLVDGGVRQLLGMRLTEVPGVGEQLGLIVPITVASIAGASLAVPLEVALAKPMGVAESEVMRDIWAIIEERFLQNPAQMAAWTDRFMVIARRENHPVDALRAPLEALSAAERARLWQIFVAHRRDGELAEAHRPSPRQLIEALRAEGFIPEDAPVALPAWLVDLKGLVDSVYQVAGVDREVMAGRASVSAEDLARWAEWVEVPEAAREAVTTLGPVGVEAALVRLAEQESGHAVGGGRLDDPSLLRGLRHFRDRYLKPRSHRSAWALEGVELLTLLEMRRGRRAYAKAIIEDLKALGAEAVATELKPVAVKTIEKEALPPHDEPRPLMSPPETAVGDDMPAVAELARGVSVAADMEVSAQVSDTSPWASPSAKVEPLEEGVAGVSPVAVVAEAAKPPIPATTPKPKDMSLPALRSPRDPRGLKSARFELPPMPTIPPPRAAPRVRPRTGFPAMPEMPRPKTSRLPSRVRDTSPAAQTVEGRHRPTVTPELMSPEPPRRSEPPRRPDQREMTHRERVVTSAPRRPEGRPDGRLDGRMLTGRVQAPASHLVTPSQANRFYEESFRELELIERDLIHRDLKEGARARLAVLAEQAEELVKALGPSARSGDLDFQSAQRHVEMVQAYIERIGSLMSQPTADPASQPRQRRSPSLLARLFRTK